MGSPSVNATGAARASSAVARRLRKPDPYARGAYSYIGVGGNGAPRALARPVEGTLFFAGEATNAAEIGTVAGALSSGRRAAREVLRVLQ